MTREIKAVYCQEPRREGEEPDVACVGFGTVTRIERRDENFGTYGIAWFDVFSDDTLLRSFNGLHVATIIYKGADR